MSVSIRKAGSEDVESVMKLLKQVLEIHAQIRPDIFISGTTKYTPEELKEILSDATRSIFVAVDEKDRVLGHLFCEVIHQPFSTNMHSFKTLYIDDLCVDENARGMHVGTILYEFALKYAKEIGCYDVTLNVWEGNDSARAFYEKKGMFVKETQMEIIL